jgi:RimJ/RimL family protein N-acetyltransferase
MQLKTQIIYRPGTLEDLPEVREVCKDVWGGNDYIPFVWEERLSDPSQQIIVLEINGQIAGFYGLKKVSETGGMMNWWQGVRVATPFKRMGLASRMVEHALELSRREGVNVFRYATADDNEPMHRLADRFGFRLVTRYSYIEKTDNVKPVPPDALQKFRKLETSEIEIAWDFIRQSHSWDKGEQIFCDHWTWRRLEDDRLRDLLGNGEVYGIFSGAEPVALALATYEEWGEKEVSGMGLWLDGEPENVVLLSQHLFHTFQALVKPEVKFYFGLMVLQEPHFDEAFLKAGFKINPSERMRLYELKLS